MLGAIIGDVAGSTYEVIEAIAKKNKIKRSYSEKIEILDKKTKLFNDYSSMTDDSILTIAVYDALINGGCYEEKLTEYGLREIKLGQDAYGRNRFGSGFVKWLKSKDFRGSYGNGCAMRISSIPEILDDLESVKKETFKATITSHNHPDSIKCAEGLAVTIFLAKNKKSKDYIKNYIETNYFSLDYDLEDLQRNYEFTSRAIDSVPEAIYIFLKSTDFEDSIRKAISIGGDTDTIASMVGAISENYYGIPENIIDEVKAFIPDNYMKIINDFYERKKDKNECKRFSRKTNRK